ncbi:hypothetical protein [Chryseobacterium lineare]
MKHLITPAVLLFSMTAFAQVGINNTSPKATLDITSKTNGTKPEGLIIPQLTGDQIRIATTATPTPVYGTAQKGLIVYASTADSAPAGATASITAPGYYYFDGSVWQKMTGTSATDATTTAKGIVQLAGDLAGTATSPTVAKIQNNAVSATAPSSGQVLGWNGTAWVPTAVDNTNDAWTNDTTNAMVKLGTNSDGTTIRTTGADFVVKDNGQVGIGTSAPSAKLEVNSGTSNTSGLKFTNLNSTSTSTTNASTLGVDVSGNVVVQSAAPVQTKFKSFSIDSNVATNSLFSMGSLEFRFTGTCIDGNRYLQVRSASGANNAGIFHGAFTDNQSGSGFVNVMPVTLSTTFSDLTSYPLNCVYDGHAQFSFFSYTDRTYYRVNVHIADGDGLGFGALGYIYVEYQK